MLRILPALMLLAVAPAAAAEDASAPIRLTPKDAQNFLAAAPGDLRIVGDENRYDIVLPADVLFDFDRSDLRPDAVPLLRQVKAHLAANRADQLHVRGYTDSKGSDEYNFVLSQKRAGAVCDWLKRENAADFTLCIGRGEEEPLLPNDNADGSDSPVNRQLNRRVTLSVVRYPDADRMLGDAKAKADAALQGLRKPAAPAQ
jgi:outer membrane protein OmpA-like peptidoglycan-associated protein